MENLKGVLNKRQIIMIIICIIALIALGIYLYINQNKYEDINSIDLLEQMENTIEEINEVENMNILNIIDCEEKEEIVVHITGQVKKTGIVYLKQGARIIDAIKEAGGATKNANLDQVNLAYTLEDGQKIYIPSKNEKIEKGEYIISNSGNNVLVEEGKSSISTSKKGENIKVNLNTANQTELETLPGIGSALAQRIIEYREINGKFEKIEDIQNVKGIGDSKYSNIKDNICI